MECPKKSTIFYSIDHRVMFIRDLRSRTMNDRALILLSSYSVTVCHLREGGGGVTPCLSPHH